MTKKITAAAITGIATDSGSSATDFYTNDRTLRVSGTVTIDGTKGNVQTLGVWAVKGSTSFYLGNVTVSATGAWQFSGASPETLADGTWTLEVFDSNSTHNKLPNKAVLASQSVTIDTVAPSEKSSAFGTVQHVLWSANNLEGAGNYKIGSAYSNAIKVADNNADTLTVTVTVGVGNTFTVGNPSVSGVTITGNGSNSVTLVGKAAAINAALNGSTYHSSSHSTSHDVNDFINVVTTDQAGNAVVKTIGIDVICFLAGTMIRTPDGEAPVETLKRGDLVLTADGAAKPVTWLGVQTVSRLFANPLRVLPIRIKAGALGDNVPARDLLVSPDHALLVEGVLVQAGALVNGSSILRETLTPAIFRYYHVELDDHSLILAENTPAETFVDNVDRMNFDNWAEHDALYPDGKPVAELPYPRAKSHRQVPVYMRVALAARAMAIGAVAEAAAAA